MPIIKSRSLKELFTKQFHKLTHFLQQVGLLKARGVIPLGFIQRYLPTDAVVVEAGACMGDDTVPMAKFWSKGQVHAFEPVPHLFQYLQQNTAKCKNVTCYPLALGEKRGTQTIHVSSGASLGSSSLLKPKEHLTLYPGVTFEEDIEVQVTTLDEWAVAHHVFRVDFLWLDLQGFEYLVLKSSPAVLSMVRAIYTEVNLKEIYEGALLYGDFKKWLQGNGFQVVREEFSGADAGNVLFAKDPG
jgi:FkbM family methyltransferase